MYCLLLFSCLLVYSFHVFGNEFSLIKVTWTKIDGYVILISSLISFSSVFLPCFSISNQIFYPVDLLTLDFEIELSIWIFILTTSILLISSFGQISMVLSKSIFFTIFETLVFAFQILLMYHIKFCLNKYINISPRSKIEGFIEIEFGFLFFIIPYLLLMCYSFIRLFYKIKKIAVYYR